MRRRPRPIVAVQPAGALQQKVDWGEVAAVARAAERQTQLATLGPWLLWAVLLAGVAGLAFMVWRLTRPGSQKV